MSRVLYVAAIFAAALTGCDNSSEAVVDETQEESSSVAAGEDPEAEFDEDSALADAEQEVADEGYSGACTSDCSGHDAGFDWAADGHDDGGVSSSPSFDEGQVAYEEAVEERMEEKRREFEAEGADSEYAM